VSRNCFRNYTRHLRLCYRRQLGIKKIISKNNHCTAFTSINSLIKTCLSSERCVEVSVKYAHNRPITKTPKDPSRISEARTAKTCSAFRWTFFLSGSRQVSRKKQTPFTVRSPSARTGEWGHFSGRALLPYFSMLALTFSLFLLLLFFSFFLCSVHQQFIKFAKIVRLCQCTWM